MQRLAEDAQQAIGRRDFPRAAALLGQLVGQSPRDHGAWYWLAFVHVRMGQPELALPAIQTAVALDKRNPEYHNLAGVALAEAADYPASMESLRKALKLKPFLTNAHFNLGKVLQTLRRFDEALEAYGRARKLEPQRTDVWQNLGLTFWQAGCVEEAHREFLAFAAAHPANPDAARNLATTSLAVEGASKADQIYQAAIAQHPADRALRWDYARFLLARGEFAKGWMEYLWRPGRDPRRWPPAGTAFTALTPAALPPRVSFEQEQGIGDLLFFARFLHSLRREGVRVAVHCDAKVVELMRGLGLADSVTASGELPGTGADPVFAIDDLASLIRSEAVAPSARLTVDPARVAGWRARFAQAGPPPYLAATWRAGTDIRQIPEFARPGVYPYKEVGVAELLQAFAGIPGTLVVVQRAPAGPELAALAADRPVLDLSSLNEDLPAMSEALSAVDEYVGVPNTNVHLMAAVGGTARVLVPYPAEWRWLLEGAESPWFPGFRTYRQTMQRKWLPALEQLRRDLQERWSK